MNIERMYHHHQSAANRVGLQSVTNVLHLLRSSAAFRISSDVDVVSLCTDIRCVVCSDLFGHGAPLARTERTC